MFEHRTRPMNLKQPALLAALLSLTLLACGSEDSATPAPSPEPDATADQPVAPTPDATPDAPAPDATPDAPPASDMPTEDMPPDDATADAPADAPSDDAPEDMEPEPAVYDPALTGPLMIARTSHEVGGYTVELHAPVAGGPYPAIVLNPGFQLGAENFRWAGERLASHGIITLIPTFGDSAFNATSHSALSDATSAMLTWLAADARVNPDQLGTAGHSRGGKVALLLATREARVKATYTLDPVDSAGGPGAQPSAQNPSVTPELMPQLTIPVVFLGTGKGGQTSFGQACAPVAENYQQYAMHAASQQAYTFTLPTAGHNDFATNPGFLVSAACAAGDDPAQSRAFARASMVAFFKLYLAQEQGYAPYLVAP